MLLSYLHCQRRPCWLVSGVLFDTANQTLSAVAPRLQEASLLSTLKSPPAQLPEVTHVSQDPLRVDWPTHTQLCHLQLYNKVMICMNLLIQIPSFAQASKLRLVRINANITQKQTVILLTGPISPKTKTRVERGTEFATQVPLTHYPT